MARPTLVLHPIHNSVADILRHFHAGRPITPEQANFLAWHQRQLSHPDFDPILRYYLKSKSDYQKKFFTSFVLPHEEINRENIRLLKKRLRIMLEESPEDQVIIHLTPQQFSQFKHYTAQELIFWHGNQFLTGAPFYPSAVPPVIHFQWGNEFGIVKYVVLPGEKALKANILIYFEDMRERDLDRCVRDYQKRMEEEIKLQNKLLQNKEIIEKHDLSLIKTPELTLAKSYLIEQLHPKPGS